MKTAHLILLLLCLSFFSCEKETVDLPQVPLKEAIVGNWLVTHQYLKSTRFTFQDPQQGVVTNWGCFYLLSLKLNKDGSYFINEANNNASASAERKQPSLGGSWKLEDAHTISLSCGTHEPVIFKVHVNKRGELVFENKHMLLRHSKRN